MGQPGEKIDLSTFIAYLLPGLIVQFLIFALIDSVILITNRASLLPNIVISDVAKLIVFGAILSIVGYFLGLIIDIYAHIFTGKYEDERKNEAYRDVVKDLDVFVKDKNLKVLLAAENEDRSIRRNTVIDTMFYQYATPSHWARQNWSWSFYEASRNLTILFMPAVVISSFYISLVIITKIFIDMGIAVMISLLASLIIATVAWRYPYRQLRGYRDQICRTYHRHRAYVALGTLLSESTSSRKNK